MMSKVCRSRGWLTTAAVYVLGACTTGAWAQTTGVGGQDHYGHRLGAELWQHLRHWDDRDDHQHGYAKTLSYGVGQYSVPACSRSPRMFAAHSVSEDTSETVWAQKHVGIGDYARYRAFPEVQVNITTAAETPTSGTSPPRSRLAPAARRRQPALVVLCDPQILHRAKPDGQLHGHYRRGRCAGGRLCADGNHDLPGEQQHLDERRGGKLRGHRRGRGAVGVFRPARTPCPQRTTHLETSDHYSSMSATTTVTVGTSAPSPTRVYQYKILQSDGSTSGYDGVGNITAYYDGAFTSGQCGTTSSTTR